MSIVTLKKKTAAKYNNMSTDRTGFSLNGTHRSQGYVGQDTLGRSLSRTPMNGNVAKGHGGCCGLYRQATIVQSGVTSTNDPSVVKSSVINPRGYLSKWIHRPQQYIFVNPDSNQNSNTQQEYIERLQTATVNTVPTCASVPITRCDYVPGKSKRVTCSITKDIADPNLTSQPNRVAISGGEYIRQLYKKCNTEADYKFTRASPAVPLPS